MQVQEAGVECRLDQRNNEKLQVKTYGFSGDDQSFVFFFVCVFCFRRFASDVKFFEKL